MQDKLNIRHYGWLQGQLSWSYVSSRLLKAFEDLGHDVYITSTNGIKDSDSFITEDRIIKDALALQDFGPGKAKSIDLDWCYTVCQNFPKRFLSNSKHKAAIYNFETTIFPPSWKKYYNLVGLYFPSSNFSAEIFHMNGIPAEKIFVVPHGVDTSVFNPDIPPIKLNTKKKYKFVSVVAPHYRKNIEAMLEAYCSAFNKDDDVCLVLKTKVYKHSDGIYDMQKNPKGRKLFEVVLGDIFKRIRKKYGPNMPEIELLAGHVKNVASIYNACDCHISATGAEGFYMPGIESFSSNLLNIAPRYSAYLDYMNDDNALLADSKTRYAHKYEQYWHYDPKALIGQVDIKHMAELLIKAYKDHDQLMEKFKPGMDAMVKKLSWEYAAQLMIDATKGKLDHYKPGTYNVW